MTGVTLLCYPGIPDPTYIKSPKLTGAITPITPVLTTALLTNPKLSFEWYLHTSFHHKDFSDASQWNNSIHYLFSNDIRKTSIGTILIKSEYTKLGQNDHLPHETKFHEDWKKNVDF